MPDSELSLHRKLAQVMYEADRIPKNGTAPAAMGGFKFVQVGDAADVIRKALAEKGVSMIPTAIEVVGETEHPTSSGKMMTTLTVRTTWTLTDGDSGESTMIQSLGSGADMGDKAAPKAQSNAMKYALLMGFLLSTGDDPELSDSSDRRSERNPRVGAADYQAPASREDGLIGVVEKGKARTTDYSLRLDPDGNGHLGFRLLGGGRAAGLIVEAHDDLAKVLASLEDEIVGQRVQAWGHFVNHPLAKGGSYDALYLERIATPDFTLPAQLAGDTAPASAVEPEPSSPSGSAEAVAPGEAASAQNLASVPERPTAA